MSEDKKPREFWIGERSYFAFTAPTWDEAQRHIHVIEHSAYAALEEKLRVAVSLLNYELDTDSVSAVRDYIDRKEQFLAKIKGGSDE